MCWLFLSDYYFYQSKKNKTNTLEQIIEKKNFITENLNKFFIFKIKSKTHY